MATEIRVSLSSLGNTVAVREHADRFPDRSVLDEIVCETPPPEQAMYSALAPLCRTFRTTLEPRFRLVRIGGTSTDFISCEIRAGRRIVGYARAQSINDAWQCAYDDALYLALSVNAARVKKLEAARAQIDRELALAQKLDTAIWDGRAASLITH